MVTAPLKASRVCGTNTFMGRAFHKMLCVGRCSCTPGCDLGLFDIFVWVVIFCTVREHWSEVAIAIGGNLLGIDPIYQEEACKRFVFFYRVIVDTLPLTVVVRDKSGRTALDVFNFSYLLPGVWVPYGATIF